MGFQTIKGSATLRQTAVAASFIVWSSAAQSEEILFDTFGGDPGAGWPSAGFDGSDELKAFGEEVAENFPDGTQFLIDQRGVGSMPIKNKSRFASARVPLMGDRRAGVYAQLGFGRDREMKRASDRLWATKTVIGGRVMLGEGMETFVEYRQVRGLDFTGVSAPEHQVSIGLSISF